MMRTQDCQILTGHGRKTPEAMVGAALPAPISAHDLTLGEQWRAFYRDELQALPRVRQRIDGHRLHSMTRMDGIRGLERAADDLRVFRNAGAPPTVGRLAIARLTEQHETMYAGTDAPDLKALRHLELAADTHEDRVECETFINGYADTVDGDLAHADALERSAAAAIELARGLRRHARLRSTAAL